MDLELKRLGIASTEEDDYARPTEESLIATN
jgi:hypothetical protein